MNTVAKQPHIGKFQVNSVNLATALNSVPGHQVVSRLDLEVLLGGVEGLRPLRAPLGDLRVLAGAGPVPVGSGKILF